jgi:hypothetical protein
MGAQLVQFPDGSAGIVNDSDAKVIARWGGPSTPALGNLSYRVPQVAVTPLGVADTGGGIFSLQNNLGFDVLVTRSGGQHHHGRLDGGQPRQLRLHDDLDRLLEQPHRHAVDLHRCHCRQHHGQGHEREKPADLGERQLPDREQDQRLRLGLAGYAYIEYVPV